MICRYSSIRILVTALSLTQTRKEKKDSSRKQTLQHTTLCRHLLSTSATPCSIMLTLPSLPRNALPRYRLMYVALKQKETIHLLTTPDSFSPKASLKTLYFPIHTDFTIYLYFNNFVYSPSQQTQYFLKIYHFSDFFLRFLNNQYTELKVILCASEHICSIVRYCFRSFKQL